MKLLKYIFLLTPFLSQAQEGTGHFGKVSINNGKVVPTQRLYVNGASYLNGTLQLPTFTNGFLTVNGSGVVGVTAGTITPTPGVNGTVLTSNGTVASWNLLTNANIATAAAIAITKLAAGTANTVFTTNGTTNSFQSITNAFISSSAAIDITKIANIGTGNVLIGGASSNSSGKINSNHVDYIGAEKIGYGSPLNVVSTDEFNTLNNINISKTIQEQIYERINKDSLRLTFNSGSLGIQGAKWGGLTTIINLDSRYLTSSSLIPYSNITGGTANAITYYNGSGVLSAGNANFVHNGTKTGIGTSTLDSTFNLVGSSRHVGNSRQLGKATFIAPNGDPNNTAIEISLGRLTLNNNENASINFGNNLLASVEGGGIYHGISSPAGGTALLLGGAASSYTSIYTNNTHRFRSGGLVQQMQIDDTGVNITNALSAPNATFSNNVSAKTIKADSVFSLIAGGSEALASGTRFRYYGVIDNTVGTYSFTRSVKNSGTPEATRVFFQLFTASGNPKISFPIYNTNGYYKATGSNGTFDVSTTIPYSDITGGTANAIAYYNGAGTLSGTGAFTWDGTRMGIGSSGSLGVGVYISQPMGANTLGQGLYINSPANDAITSDIRLIEANANTSSGTNVLNVSNFRASKGTFAGSVTNHYGFHADNSLTSAANNYGFYSDIATAANRWNFYANGTAPSYFGGAIGVNVTVPTTTNGGVDIASGGYGLIGGADNGNTTRTDATTKIFRIGSAHYTNSEEPIGVLAMVSSSTANTLTIGAGMSNMNTPTAINFSTGATTTTLTGGTRMTLDANGMIGMPSVASNTTLNVSKAMSGATTLGVLNSGQIQSDVTTGAFYFNTSANSVAGTYTVPNLFHYSAGQGVFNGGTINNQYGFYVNSSMVGGVNNYSFRSDVIGAPGRWGLYMNGDVQNYIRGNIGVGSGKTVPTYTVDVNGTVAANRFLNQGSAPTIAAGAGAGTGATVSITAGSTDNWFQVNVTTGTTPTALAVVATITLNGGAYSTLSPGGCTPSNAATALLTGVYFTNTTSTLAINANAAALGSATAYVWDCWKGGK
jgi:hypothetical protein